MWVVDRVQSLVIDAKEWSTGRIWVWRVAILIYIVYAGYCHMVDPTTGDLFSGLTLGVHELGHVLLGWAPQTVMIAAGSAAQILGPVALLIGFSKQRDYFGITIAGSWLSCSMFGLATYIGDARAQQLPLVGLDSNPIHDWNFLLSNWGLLQMDTQIAQVVSACALTVLVASAVWGIWLSAMMIMNPGPAKEQMVKF